MGVRVRLAVTPSSPPKNPGSISVAAWIISPTPSEMSAKMVPARRVVTAPNTMPKASPAAAPASGTSGTGTGRPAFTARRKWIEA